MDRMQSSATASIGRAGGVGGGPKRGKPVQKPKDFRGTMSMLWSAMRGLRGELAAVCLMALTVSGLSVVIPLLAGRAIDACGTGPGEVRFPELRAAVWILAAVYATDVVLLFLREFLMAGLSQTFVCRLRRNLFAKLQHLPLGFFDTHASGDLMSRLTNDMDTISGSVGQAAVQLITGVLTVAGTLGAMIAESLPMSAAVLLTVPLIYVLTRVVTRHTGPLFRAQQTVLGELGAHIEETITGIETVRAYGQEETAKERFARANEELRRVSTRAHEWSAAVMPLLNVINNFGFVLVSAAGGVLALRGEVGLGTIAAFVSLTKQFVRPLNEIANTYNTFLSAIAGAERVFEVMSEPEEAVDRPGAAVMSESSGGAAVEFCDVSFGYRPDKQVLRHVSFTVPPHTRAAFVGPTGAGKTTIINLLTRFYDVTEGSILVDGRDIRDYTRDSVRSTFGIVLQETYLFGGTIMDNIRYGRPEASDEEVREAARTAGADRFITRLRDGYSTQVEDNGGNLSAGQRQLLALARAVLSDPAILILDEATSSVDTRTELHIQHIMRDLMRGRTTFVIAHRLGTIRDADCIFVVDGGEIVERGRHAELMEKKGAYYRMYTAQFGMETE